MKTQVKSIMTRQLVTFPAEGSLQEAHQLMQEKRIRHLPITNQNAVIVGILSDADIIGYNDLIHLTPEQAMNPHVDYVHQDMALRSVILKMLEKKLTAMLICDDAQVAVGIVTSDDLLWYLSHLLEKEKDQSTLMSLLDIQTLDRAANQISNAGL